MISQWLERARAGEPVWLPDMRAQCAGLPDRVDVTMQLTLCDGTKRDFPLPLPRWENDEQRQFVLQYVTASVWNTLSALSGQELAFYLDPAETQAAALLRSLEDVFQLRQPQRRQYGKVINIADRLCRAFGCGPFTFALRDSRDYTPAPPFTPPQGALTRQLRRAAQRCGSGVCCGIDIGGTDIKAAVSVDGRLVCVKEYDWNPAASPTAEGITGPIVLLVRLMACCAAGLTPALRQALEKDAPDELMARAVAASPTLPLDVLGVSFPDVVIRDRIVGGESPKTQGMRGNTAVDYETAFARLGDLLSLLRPYCRDGAAIHMTNDGHIAAFTAAAELSWQGDPDLSGGVVAHALGTDFGMGFLYGDGSIPEMPVELYDSLLDMGSFPQRELSPDDLRSTRNENSGLPGARRYVGQASAFRLAHEADPSLLDGFTDTRGSLLTVPADKRKDCLAHLMERAADGVPAAQQVFRQIGRNVGQISRELSLLLHPATDVRYLFGRFVKDPVCFRLLQEGCREIVPSLCLEAADEELSCTPLMRALPDQGVTVAQFGQAIGAMYYAAMER